MASSILLRSRRHLSSLYNGLIRLPAPNAMQQGSGNWKTNFMSTQKRPLMGGSTGDPNANFGDSALGSERRESSKASVDNHGWDDVDQLKAQLKAERAGKQRNTQQGFMQQGNAQQGFMQQGNAEQGFMQQGNGQQGYTQQGFIGGGIRPIIPPEEQNKKAFVVHFRAIRNNAFVTVTDAKGNKKVGASAGSLEEFKGGARLSRYAGQACAEHVGRLSRSLGMTSVVMKVKGFTFFGKKKKTILSWREGYTSGVGGGDLPRLVSIRDVTQLPHNGCRLPKKRRI